MIVQALSFPHNLFTTQIYYYIFNIFLKRKYAFETFMKTFGLVNRIKL